MGASAVRVAEVELGSGADPRDGATLLAFGEAEVPPGVIRGGVVEEPSALAQVVREAWAHAKPSSKNVVLGLGSPSIVVREVDIPAQPMDKVRSSLAFHVQDQLPMAAEDVIMDFYPTAEFEAQGGATLRGLLVAAPRSLVRDVTDVLHAAGVKVAAVDHSAFGLWRIGCRGDIARDNVAFVDVGAQTTTVVISQAGAVRLVRAMPHGGHDGTKAVAQALKGENADPELAKRAVGMVRSEDPDRKVVADAVEHATGPLIESVRNTLVYFASGNPGAAVARIVLTGGGSQLQGFGQALASATRLPVMIGDPLQGIRIGKKADTGPIQGREIEFATAIGLAAGGVK
ncbi:pilus assembly protein PilM [Demequina pelophila]|uniref:pilus assembly protein PilM n=1 Tax=Demequina pelophila TaxID=1638984 RepID=UPI0007862701|nr:pilus assembly protein PilM [Demequina pelophila]